MERGYIRSSFLPASYGISRFNRLAFKCSGAITTCATPRILIAFLCLCFAPPAFAKLGETVPQLVKRFGRSYTVEDVQLDKAYKFRSANVSVDVIVANGRSVCETYLSDHPLTATGEPPNEIVRAILRTNVPKARWVEMEAAPSGANYAMRSADREYIAILKYTGAQPENAAWTMTVGLAQAFATLSTPAPTPPKQLDQQHPTPVATQPTATEPASKQNQAQRVEFESIKAKAESGDADFQYQLGLRYYDVNGVAKNFSEAAEWYRKSAY